MISVGRMMVVVGLLLVVAGGAVWAAGRMGFRGLPGDFQFGSGQTRVYIPLATSLLLSLLLTALLWAWRWISGR